jgi:hypothetical protein
VTRTPTRTPTPAPTLPPGALTVTFDSKAGQDQPLNGQYPVGVIDWGSGRWYHSGPWGAFTTKSVSFAGSGGTSASFTFVVPRRLLSVRLYNGGSSTATAAVKCSGETDAQITLTPGQTATLVTGWAGACSVVTFTSTNGWDTNFDDLIHDGG